MFKERNKAVPAVYAILKKDDQVLMLRRKGSGYYDGWYSLPAGHVEADELPFGALVRETKEEVGISIDPKDVQLAHMMYRIKQDETGDRTDIFFEIKKWSGEPKIMEPNKADDLRWFPMTALPENTVHYIKEALENAEKGISYSEIDLAHTHFHPTK